MHIYQLPLSLYSFKLRLALRLKGLSIPLHEPPGGSYRSDAYRAINPAGTIPALIDGELMLTETDSIIEYLDERGDGEPLLPQDVPLRARTRMLSRWVDLRLEAGIRSLFGQVPPRSRDPLAVAAADQRIAASLSLIGQAVDSAGPFMLGRRPGMADCGLVSCLLWLDAIGPPLALQSQAGAKLSRAMAAMAGDDRISAEIAAYRPLVAAWVGRTTA